MRRMLGVMGTLRRFVAVRTIIVGEYLAAAAVLVALVYPLAATPPPPSCVGACAAFDGFVLALIESAGLVLLTVGLPVALLIAAVRQRRRRRRTSSGRPTVPHGELAAATIAAAWGVAVALPIACILAVPVARLLT